MSGAELHAHTTASDGLFTPLEAVDYALNLGLEALAITDHDSMAGVSEAQVGAKGLAIEVIPGVEISCEHDGGAVHLLAYWPDMSHPELADELGAIRQSRRTRAREMVERLRELGHPITIERVMEFARGGNPGRPHVAEALIEAGVIANINEAFTPELIGTGGRAYVPKYTLVPARAVRLVLESGGVPVLAHPGLYRMPQTIPDELIESLARLGLVGLEANHFDHSPEMSQKYAAMARDLDLIVTSGSDCHGGLYDPIRMGSCRATMDMVEALRSHARPR